MIRLEMGSLLVISKAIVTYNIGNMNDLVRALENKHLTELRDGKFIVKRRVMMLCIKTHHVFGTFSTGTPDIDYIQDIKPTDVELKIQPDREDEITLPEVSLSLPHICWLI